jgi:hypothetical protein
MRCLRDLLKQKKKTQRTGTEKGMCDRPRVASWKCHESTIKGKSAPECTGIYRILDKQRNENQVYGQATQENKMLVWGIPGVPDEPGEAGEGGLGWRAQI